MAEAGVQIEDNASYIGHVSTSAIQATYAKLPPEYLQRAVDML